ncbi:hypothetical protein PP353_gp65 [Arthrobacter phage Kumotta]|uniref:Uncharacterized protein n=2 Tax=Kumottavirus TaxID=3044749 RepID=A0A4Y6EVY6_9CAUD|nr:hypothetical protein PP353_gp65 [Arthrobacter phage Kumotta]YP_010649543.1 hypothetical protein PP356_gp61 [Arthrobacter phage MargaretKali]AXH44441.1 hypothetical protein SEA_MARGARETKALI_61 [Arthrobacter phage MargaretKali]QDF19574.1 hypothetical protein SEA_KUMOTTA_65 [Arthrobacter phage Kumotta]
MTEDLRAENERLTNLNDGLSRQLIAMGQRLENSRRELMATGWDAAVNEADSRWSIGAASASKLKADNPYRKPVIDLSGAIICKTGDQS